MLVQTRAMSVSLALLLCVVAASASPSLFSSKSIPTNVSSAMADSELFSTGQFKFIPGVFTNEAASFIDTQDILVFTRPPAGSCKTGSVWCTSLFVEHFNYDGSLTTIPVTTGQTAGLLDQFQSGPASLSSYHFVTGRFQYLKNSVKFSDEYTQVAILAKTSPAESASLFSSTIFGIIPGGGTVGSEDFLTLSQISADSLIVSSMHKSAIKSSSDFQVFSMGLAAGRGSAAGYSSIVAMALPPVGACNNDPATDDVFCDNFVVEYTEIGNGMTKSLYPSNLGSLLRGGANKDIAHYKVMTIPLLGVAVADSKHVPEQIVVWTVPHGPDDGVWSKNIVVVTPDFNNTAAPQFVAKLWASDLPNLAFLSSHALVSSFATFTGPWFYSNVLDDVNALATVTRVPPGVCTANPALVWCSHVQIESPLATFNPSFESSNASSYVASSINAAHNAKTSLFGLISGHINGTGDGPSFGMWTIGHGYNSEWDTSIVMDSAHHNEGPGFYPSSQPVSFPGLMKAAGVGSIASFTTFPMKNNPYTPKSPGLMTYGRTPPGRSVAPWVTSVVAALPTGQSLAKPPPALAFADSPPAPSFAALPAVSSVAGVPLTSSKLQVLPVSFRLTGMDLFVASPSLGLVGTASNSKGDATTWTTLLEKTTNFGGCPVTGAKTSISMHDFNADGLSEALVVTPGLGTLCLMGNPSADGATWTAYYKSASGVPGFDLKGVLSQVIPVDINGDKWTDLLMFDPESGGLFISMNSGGTSFGTATAVAGFSHIGATARIIPVDMNVDGLVDLIAYVPGRGVFQTYLGNGLGAFTSVKAWTSGIGSTNFLRETTIVQVWDYDSNGRPDLLVTTPGSGEVSVLRNVNGDGATWTEVYANAGGIGCLDFKAESDVAILIDYDENGLQDLLLIGRGRGIANFMYNDGLPASWNPTSCVSKSTTGLPGFPLTRSTDVVVAQDVNSDGRTDLVMFGSGQLVIGSNTYNQ